MITSHQPVPISESIRNSLTHAPLFLGHNYFRFAALHWLSHFEKAPPRPVENDNSEEPRYYR